MNKEVYKHLFATYGKKPGLWFAFGAEVVRAFVGRVITVILIANMVAAVSTGNFDTAQNMILIWGALTLFSTLLSTAAELVGVKTENNVYSELITAYYKKMTTKDMAFYRDHHTGYLTAMFRQYLDSAILLSRLLRGEALRVFISLVFPAVVLFIASWKIGIIAVLLVISQAVYMFWASAKANQYREASHEIYREISGEVADDVTNIVAYKSSGKEKEALQRINELRKKETYAFWKRRAVVVWLDLPRNLLTLVLVGAAYWMVLKGTDDRGDSVKLLILTTSYMFQVLRNITDLPDVITRHDDLVTNILPTMDVLKDEYETILDTKDAKEFKAGAGKIEIKSLSFKYNDDHKAKYIFKDLNLTIAGGERVGIVGLSGAGKSTLASLIMRFDDIQSGKILIDGMDIREVTQSSLRRNIAYVPQEPLLFHRSIRNNIVYHNDMVTDKEVEQAAKAAHAHEFIKELPNQYETVVGERGVKLSGGQKQRVVIARAVLKKAPIILFDEATSALDSESEHIIQQALPTIIGNHTAIIIAHRLSTVARLDRIIVMHNGKIEEEGSHQQLLAQKGRYYSLWQRQTSEDLS